MDPMWREKRSILCFRTKSPLPTHYNMVKAEEEQALGRQFRDLVRIYELCGHTAQGARRQAMGILNKKHNTETRVFDQGKVWDKPPGFDSTWFYGRVRNLRAKVKPTKRETERARQRRCEFMKRVETTKAKMERYLLAKRTGGVNPAARDAAEGREPGSSAPACTSDTFKVGPASPRFVDLFPAAFNSVETIFELEQALAEPTLPVLLGNGGEHWDIIEEVCV